ncbi:MAG: endonuclease [Saprospiraceae bacterium]|nr:endonuclease [Saprospiraceae bacterium]
MAVSFLLNMYKKLNSIYLSVILCLFTGLLHGQTYHNSVFPGLEGQELLDSLVKTYKSFSLLPYSPCRDTLFANIDAKNDSLECIYTGMKRFIPAGVDPTDAVLLNGQPNGINTEHSYPQSKGASGYGRSDMHILYPSRVKTNSTRVNNPFGEIPDNVTSTWFYSTFEMTSPPVTNRDAYSESTNTKFEPRESVKGNLARSVFYFYSMYRFDAINADPAYFSLQIEDLCTWHFNDPVDSTEWNRTLAIEKYQKNKNPFVIDCSLASRLYCQNISDACESLTGIKSETSSFRNVKLYPNPGKELLFIQHGFGQGRYSFFFRDIHGRDIFSSQGTSESNVIDIDVSMLPDGFYFLIFKHENSTKIYVDKYVLRR